MCFISVHDWIECLFTFAIAVLGFIMFIAPEKSTKKDYRKNKNAVASTKKCGLKLMLVGVLASIVLIVINLS